MFTVILLSPSAKRIFERCKVFFDPFVKSGDIAFCEWRHASEATDLTEVVPDLTEAIRGKMSWRAVVVDHPRGEADIGERDPENPFDFIRNTQIELNLEDSPFPLVRLANLLLGYPDMTVKGFERWISYVDQVSGEEKYVSPHELGDGDEQAFNQKVADLNAHQRDVRAVFREQEYSSEEQEVYRRLEAKYRMKEVRPSEVVFIATRSRVADNPKEELRKVWRSGDEVLPSRFIERNDYPPQCRFAVYELLEEENSAYEQDELRMWLSVLTLATNLMPPSGFQADRLYQLGVEFNDQLLAGVLNEHLSVLSTGLGIVEREMQQEPPQSEVDVAELLRPAPVPVVFDGIGGHELQVATTGYHLATDKPRDEWGHWSQEVNRLRQDGARFMGRPRRALVHAVGDMQRELALDKVPDEILGDIVAEELDEALSDELQELSSPVTSGALSRAKLDAAILEQDRKVSRRIGTRLRRRTIWASLALVCGIWFAGLVPYLVQAYRKGGEVLTGAAGLTLLVLVVGAATVLLTLVAMKWQLVSRLRRVNETLRMHVMQVNEDAEAFATYLGRFASYRRARGRLERSRELIRDQGAQHTQLAKLRQKILGTMDSEKAIMTSLGLDLRVTRRLHDRDDFNPRDEAEVHALFRLAKGDGEAEFNRSGQVVRSPYDFITRVNIETLAVAEPQSVRHQEESSDA